MEWCMCMGMCVYRYIIIYITHTHTHTYKYVINHIYMISRVQLQFQQFRGKLYNIIRKANKKIQNQISNPRHRDAIWQIISRFQRVFVFRVRSSYLCFVCFIYHRVLFELWYQTYGVLPRKGLKDKILWKETGFVSKRLRDFIYQSFAISTSNLLHNWAIQRPRICFKGQQRIIQMVWV